MHAMFTGADAVAWNTDMARTREIKNAGTNLEKAIYRQKGEKESDGEIETWCVLDLPRLIVANLQVHLAPCVPTVSIPSSSCLHSFNASQCPPHLHASPSLSYVDAASYALPEHKISIFIVPWLFRRKRAFTTFASNNTWLRTLAFSCHTLNEKWCTLSLIPQRQGQRQSII